MTYKITFTPLGKAFAKAKSSLETVEAKARAEIQDLFENGLENLEDLFFHVVDVGPERGDVSFICTPHEGGILIDSATYEESDKLDTGPLKGKRVLFPSGDSE